MRNCTVGDVFAGTLVGFIPHVSIIYTEGKGRGLLRQRDFLGQRFDIGQTLLVEVTHLNHENNGFLVALKRSQESWFSITNRFPVGGIFLGEVHKTVGYPLREFRVNRPALYISLEPGVLGFVYPSELSWSLKFTRLSFPLGLAVKVKVLSFGLIPGHINLSIKQCLPNPWLDFSEKQKSGSIVTGIVEAVTEFGVFVGLKASPTLAPDNNVHGVVALPDVAWNRPASAIRKYKVGDVVEAMVLSVDHEKQRISLGIKQLAGV